MLMNCRGELPLAGALQRYPTARARLQDFLEWFAYIALKH